MKNRKFKIDIGGNSESALEALPYLLKMDPNEGYHDQYNLRPPLGAYNVSVSRLSNRIVKCCGKLERFIGISPDINVLMKSNSIRDEIVDYLELALHSTAEHVDDLDSIVKSLFSEKSKYKKSKPVTEFSRTIKKEKKFITSIINAIKHHQNRIRMYTAKVNYTGMEFCLNGYFVESVENGTVGPSKMFHKESNKIFSITSLVWEMICFILISSHELGCLFKHFGNKITKKADENSSFLNAVVAGARLPLYSFDEKHPFPRTTIIIHGSDEALNKVKSGIYGSLLNVWREGNDFKALGDCQHYEGDGVTQNFKIEKPNKVKFIRWSN